MAGSTTSAPVRIETFRPGYAADFASLNLEWIEQHFAVEPQDELLFSDPGKNIVGAGGEIFFLLEGSRPVGTVALIPRDDLVVELHKMAVTRAARGRGYGARLMEAAIGWARRHSKRWVLLYSNTALESAIRLYRRYGFQALPPGMDQADVTRSDITMLLELGGGTE